MAMLDLYKPLNELLLMVERPAVRSSGPFIHLLVELYMRDTHDRLPLYGPANRCYHQTWQSNTPKKKGQDPEASDICY